MPRTGRPRAFDLVRALDAALVTFWKHGYEGASLGALTEAMEINRPALYHAFGSKQELFHRALDRYYAVDGAGTIAALDEPTVAGATSRFLHRWAAQLTQPDRPPGCFTVQTGLACSAENQDVRDELARRRGLGETALRRRYEATAEELPAGQDPQSLAGFVWTVGLGLAVQAAGGATRTELDTVVDNALQLLFPPERGPAPSVSARRPAAAE